MRVCDFFNVYTSFFSPVTGTFHIPECASVTPECVTDEAGILSFVRESECDIHILDMHTYIYAQIHACDMSATCTHTHTHTHKRTPQLMCLHLPPCTPVRLYTVANTISTRSFRLSNLASRGSSTAGGTKSSPRVEMHELVRVSKRPPFSTRYNKNDHDRSTSLSINQFLNLHPRTKPNQTSSKSLPSLSILSNYSTSIHLH